MKMRTNRRRFLLSSAAALAATGPARAHPALLGAGGPGGSGGAIAAPFASVNGAGGPDDYLNGWSAQYATTPPALNPDSNPTKFTVLRQGYDGAASVVVFRDTYVVTQRVRQPYPNQGSLSPLTVALSDYVYATDLVDGAAANNSTLTSPAPIANWVMPDRTTVANSLGLELVAFHRDARNGRQVAAVKFIATDGTSTVTRIVNAPSISAGQPWGVGDQHPVIVYACALDISTLSDNALITVNAEVYPWVGATASVARSAGSSNRREFSPRYFYRNTALAASPTYAYVQTTGNDSTGVASINAGAAAASPFLTVAAAIAKIASAAGKLDNGVVRVGPGTFTLNANAVAQSQACSLFTITRDPATTTSQSQAVVTCGANSFRPKITSGFLVGSPAAGCARFQDLTVRRDGTAGTFLGESANRLEVQFLNVTFDQNSQVASWLSNADDYVFGASILNVATTGLGASSASQHRIYRGVTVDMGTGYAGMERWVVIGCTISRPGAFNTGSGALGGFSGSILAFNRLNDPVSNGNFCDDMGASADVAGAVLAQNLFEWISPNNAPCFGVSSDHTSGANTHVVIHNNTFTGFFVCGRANVFYDDGTADRKSLLQSCRGNIWVNINTKGDIFRGVNEGDAAGAPSRLGNWGYLYGVGCQGEFAQYIDGSGGAGTLFSQAYPGLGANIGTSTTVRNDPLFTNYQGVQNTSAPGSGGGTYTLQSGSPCRRMLASAVLPYDLSGAARATTRDTAGAYA